MESVDLIEFDVAISETIEQKRTLILGNGFSVSWNHSIFSYRSLRESAISLTQNTQAVFAKLDTVDFEEVIRAYEYSSEVCDVYGIPNEFKKTAEHVRSLLIDTLAQNHPASPADISNSEYDLCIKFLSHFNGIYTLNYDMLLYWVLMKDMFRDDGSSPILNEVGDGFAYNGEDFLNWDGAKFEIHYLHGALHLFEEDELVKLNYRNTNKKLKDQFIELIQKQKKFPLFVAEGSKSNKLRRIRSSGYLTRCLNSLQKIGTKSKPQSVFTFGASFSDNDIHVLQALGKNNCHNFYIGIYGDPQSEENQKLIKNAKKIEYYRSCTRNPAPVSIKFFDSSSAKVWR